MDDAALVQPPRRGRAILFVAIPVALVTMLLVGILVTRDSAADRADFDRLHNKPAPALVGTTLDGKPFNLDDYKGDWVVLNFFAQWCVPCQQEHADLVSFSQRHEQAKDGVQLVSVVFNDDLDKVKDFFAKNGGDWPVVTGDSGRMALDYSVVRVPDTYVIDPFGVVRDRLQRPVQNTDELDSIIGQLSAQLFGSDSSGSSNAPSTSSPSSSTGP
jgi:cytochrome c biogenesis protein CcmG, thiol:disulfide interchange protein DsbE